MKADAPEKIFLEWYRIGDEKYREWCIIPKTNDEPVEYTCTDVFIEKALKWYCLDCECNDNCKDIKCFFYREFERYLKGKENCLPPKFSDVILNEDGSTSDNWRHRHFISKMQDVFIEKAAEWITENYLKYPSEDCTDTKKFVNDFKNALKI